MQFYTPRQHKSPLNVPEWEKFSTEAQETHEKPFSIKSNDIRRASTVHDGNDDLNLILQQIFIVIASVFRPP